MAGSIAQHKWDNMLELSTGNNKSNYRQLHETLSLKSKSKPAGSAHSNLSAKAARLQTVLNISIETCEKIDQQRGQGNSLYPCQRIRALLSRKLRSVPLIVR